MIFIKISSVLFLFAGIAWLIKVLLTEIWKLDLSTLKDEDCKDEDWFTDPQSFCIGKEVKIETLALQANTSTAEDAAPRAVERVMCNQ